MGDAALFGGLVHSGGKLGIALSNGCLGLGGDVFALREFAGAEVLGRQVRAALVHAPQAVVEVADHLIGAGCATALDVGDFLLHSLAVGEVILPAAFRGLLPLGECRGNDSGARDCTEQAQNRSGFWHE